MDGTGVLGALGVVLAGGRSSRMGKEKAALEIGGEPLLLRVVRRLARALPEAREVLVVGPEELGALLAEEPQARVTPDRRPGLGPLAGLETAFLESDAEAIFVVACDMPFVAPGLARAMVALAERMPESDVVALRSAHGVEQLHAVYRRSCLPAITAQLDAGDLALHSLLAGLHVQVMAAEEAQQYDPQGLSAFNANAPADWERALTLALADQI